jgi:pimeloyl-ACP methyl ester carboxylesterase
MRIGRRAALTLPLAPTAAAAATRLDARTVSYGPREADLYLQPGRRPVVALLHDSLTVSSRRSLDAVARDITARTAYHCVNFDYGGADDVETAMAWLTSPGAAALGLENNVVLIGHGVGGQLAFRHALRGSPALKSVTGASARLRGVVAVNAPLDLREARALGIDGVSGDSPIALLPPAMTSSLRTAAWTAWEESLVAETAFSLVHGLADDIVPPALSTRFVVAAATGGIPSEYHQIKGEGHGSMLDPASTSWRAARAAAVGAFRKRPPSKTLRMAPTRRVDTDREILIRTLRM